MYGILQFLIKVLKLYDHTLGVYSLSSVVFQMLPSGC